MQAAVRFSLARFFPTALTALATVACSSSSDAPPVVQQPVTSYVDAGSVAVSPIDASPADLLPPIASDASALPIDYDAGIVMPVVDAGPIPCVATGELEIEPNDMATPNDLNSIRCGVLTPGDHDYLRVTRTGYVQFQYNGAVNVTASQPIPGGPYILDIEALNPSVTTYWMIGYSN